MYLSVCLHVFTAMFCMCVWCLQGLEKGIRTLGTGATVGCELPAGRFRAEPGSSVRIVSTLNNQVVFQTDLKSI